MTLPFAALGALVAALLETTALAEIPFEGATVNLVLVLAIVATLVMGVEDGLVWAFAGGLLLDMLTPARPLGTTTLSLLLVMGIAAVTVRTWGTGGRWRPVLATFALTWVFHLLFLLVLVLVEGVGLGTLQPRVVLVAAILNSLLALPVALLFTALERRFGPAERSDW